MGCESVSFGAFSAYESEELFRNKPVFFALQKINKIKRATELNNKKENKNDSKFSQVEFKFTSSEAQ